MCTLLLYHNHLRIISCFFIASIVFLPKVIRSSAEMCSYSVCGQQSNWWKLCLKGQEQKKRMPSGSLINSSIFCCLSRVRSQWQQVEDGGPDLLLGSVDRESWRVMTGRNILSDLNPSGVFIVRPAAKANMCSSAGCFMRHQVYQNPLRPKNT